MKRFFQTVRRLTRPINEDIDGQKQRTKSLSIWEGSLWSIMWGLGESYIAPFALYLGASNLVMAFVGTGPVLITALTQLLAASILDRIGRRKPVILLGISIQTFAFLPLFLLPVFLPAGGILALIFCITLYFFCHGLTFPAWMSMMGDVVEPDERGRYFANRSRITMYSMVGALMLAGLIANSWKVVGHTAVGFGFLFGIAALVRFTSIFFMKQHYDAPMERQDTTHSFSFIAFLRDPKHANYARFTFTVALMNGTTNIAGPFFAVYMLRDLHWSYLMFTSCILTFMLSQTLFVRWWGNIGDRHGNRAVLVATGCLLPVLPLFWILSTSFPFLLLVHAISGATWCGFNLAASNFIYDSMPQADRARASGYYSVVNGTCSVIGGMLVGAFIAEHAPTNIDLGLIQISLQSSIPVVFFVSGVARAIAAAIMLPQFQEVREIEPISTVRILWRLGIGQPLYGQVGEFMPKLRNLIPPKNKP